LKQKIYGPESGCYKVIADIVAKHKVRKLMIVCDLAYDFLPFKNYLDGLDVAKVKFSDFGSNPQYESVVKGVKLFGKENCDGIVAVGGGSAIDVAKCIKLYCRMKQDKNFLEQEMADTKVSIIAIPTTAGTGSESTRYAVIYYEGKKQSVAHDSILPDYAILEPSVLVSLPLFQKKCTMLDALCQGIESWWSVNSTDASKVFSKQAVQLIVDNWEKYIFNNDSEAAKNVMLAANLAGRAINITQTTAAHAMSYKITSLYNIPHGYAVALCLPKLWRFMNSNLEKVGDRRGRDYLTTVFHDIAEAMGRNEVGGAIDSFERMMGRLELSATVMSQSVEDLDTLVTSVNPVRLKNNPVLLTKDDFRVLYKEIVHEG